MTTLATKATLMAQWQAFSATAADAGPLAPDAPIALLYCNEDISFKNGQLVIPAFGPLNIPECSPAELEAAVRELNWLAVVASPDGSADPYLVGGIGNPFEAANLPMHEGLPAAIPYCALSSATR